MWTGEQARLTGLALISEGIPEEKEICNCKVSHKISAKNIRYIDCCYLALVKGVISKGNWRNYQVEVGWKVEIKTKKYVYLPQQF